MIAPGRPEQADLFSAARAHSRSADHSSSHRAADRATASGLVSGHEQRIHAALAEIAPRRLSALGIARKTGLDHVAVARRLKAMERRGLIQSARQPGERIQWWIDSTEDKR